MVARSPVRDSCKTIGVVLTCYIDGRKVFRPYVAARDAGVIVSRPASEASIERPLVAAPAPMVSPVVSGLAS